jgi:predicted nucleotide-binding protein
MEAVCFFERRTDLQVENNVSENILPVTSGLKSVSSTNPHSVTSQNTSSDSFTAVTTSDLNFQSSFVISSHSAVLRKVLAALARRYIT